MKRMIAGVLDVAYLEAGPPDGAPVILLHGFPYDAHGYESAMARLAGAGRRCIAPFLRGYGATRFLQPNTPRSGQQAALGADLLALMDALAIPQAVLAGYDWGGRAACVLAALHPDRVRGLVSCGAAYNIQDIAGAAAPAAPAAEHRSWYVYYFATERGRAGLAGKTDALCRLLWTQWSPNWAFGDDTFARSAASFSNPDFVAVVIHSYRYRLGNAPGDPTLDAWEARLAAKPAIGVPTILLQGADDGITPPEPEAAFAPRFSGRCERHILPGIGHNVPQEAPAAFADAVLALG